MKIQQLMASGYIRMKTERAKDHLDAFNRLVADFLPKAYTVTTKDDLEAGCCTRRTEFHAFPPEIGMEYGEFLYCLRSGLDQFAWYLATDNARKLHSKDVCFPIIERVSNSEDRRNLRKTLELFPPETATAIDSLQPYKSTGDAQSHPLWQLNRLCNLDKHCFIPIHSRGKPIFVPTVGVQRILNDEDAVEVIVPLAFKHHFDFDPNLPGEVELGDWESNLVIPRYRLSDIYGFITCTVIPSLIKFDRRVMELESVPIRVGEKRIIRAPR